MNGTIMFWAATACLSGLTVPFLWPLKQKGRTPLFILGTAGTIGLAYILYGLWGNTTGLKAYHSEAQYAHRQKQATMRPLLIQFRKAEQRYLLRVENNPKDREAWLNLGQIYLIQQDEARAAVAFERARALAAEQS